MNSLNSKQLAILAAFSAFVRSHFNALTINTLDRSGSYWHEASAKWAKQFGRSEECAKLCEGLPVGQLAHVLTMLPQMGFATISERMASESGWNG